MSTEVVAIQTFTTLWIKEALNSESTLILLPSLGLLSQTLHEWTAAKNQDFAVLCVCSDESVGKKSGDEAVHDIADLAFPVSSNPVKIAKFLNQVGPKVVFSTYQSSNLISDAQADRNVPAFNLAIADEAHRCAGDKAGNFATILDGQHIRASKRLFTTATPRTYSTALKKGAEDRGIEIVGMDNEEVFGRRLYTLNFGQAIKDELLTDYRVVIVGVDSPMIASYIENREFVKTETGLEKDAETLAAQVALLKAMKDFDLRRMISFHSKVNRADDFASDLKDVAQWVDTKHRPSGEIKADFVSGEMPTFVRRQKLTMLKNAKDNERVLLTNARCLSEGVDVPSLDGVAFIDPRASQVDIIQAVGRAIRLSPNKNAGTIVLPVFISHGENPEQALDQGNFKPIWDVLNALKSHDDVLADELDQMRVGMGKRGSSKVQGGFSKIEIDLPASVDKSFSDSIQTRLVESTTESWEFMFGLLQEYQDKNLSCLVPQDYVTNTKHRLGAWVSQQRLKRFAMTDDRKRKLESLNSWTWDAREQGWQDAYNLLTRFINTNGHAAPVATYKSENGFRLGQWVAVQRTNRNNLSPERIKSLEKLDGWSWILFDKKWDDAFNCLKNYVVEFKDLRNLTSNTIYQNRALGSWVTTQRSKKSKLNYEQIQKLESLPKWTWNAVDQLWNDGYNALLKYIEIYGTTRVPKEYKTEDGLKLGNWVSGQRNNKSKLTQERFEKLNALTGWVWDVSHAQWTLAYGRLLDFVKENQTAEVPVDYVSSDGFELGAWVGAQRLAKDKKLSVDKQKLLDTLPGWTWDARERRWLDGFNALVEYLNENSNTMPLPKYVNPSGIKLGTWVANQRKDKNRMPQDRVAKLESLKCWSWNPKADLWETGFNNLVSYTKQFKTSKVPGSYVNNEGFKLGLWVSNQRTRKSSCPIERIERLELLPDWTWSRND